MTKLARILALLIAPLLTAGFATAQTTEVAFGDTNHNAAAPVEIIADSFSLDQKAGNAEFRGNVVVGQGDMRFSADLITVVYEVEDGEQTGNINKMEATGHVTLVAGDQAAEADKAVYDVENAAIIMTGNVLFTQGSNALSGGKMTIDLKDGAARFEGRVRTIFNTGASE